MSPCAKAQQLLTQAATLRDKGFLGRALRNAETAHTSCPTDSSRQSIDELRTDLWIDDEPLAEYSRARSAADKENARILYAAGQILRNRDSDYVNALDRFDQSYALWPKVLTIVQIGLTHEAAGRSVEFRKANARAIAIAEASQGETARHVIPTGHVGATYDVAYSPDGTLLATAGADASIKIWDLTSGRILHTFDGHTGRVKALAFHPDGTRLVSASEDATVKVWALDAEDVQTFRAHPSGVVAAFSPNGESFLVATDEALEIRSVLHGRVVQTLEATDIAAVSYSPDGTMLAVGLAAGHVHLWDLAEGSITATIDASELEELKRLSYSPNGELLAVTGRGLRVWNTTTGTERTDLSAMDDREFENTSGDRRRVVIRESVVEQPDGTFVQTQIPYRAFFNAVEFGADGSTLIGVSENGRTLITDLSNGSTRTLEWPERWTYAISVSPDAALVAFATNDRIEVRETGNGKLWRELGANEDSIDLLSLEFDGAKLLVADEDDASFGVWDPASPSQTSRIALRHAAAWAEISPNGRTVASVFGEATLWSTDTLDQVGTLEGNFDHISHRPGTNQLALAKTNSVVLWNTEDNTWTTISNPAGRSTRGARQFAFSRDGTRLAYGGQHGAIRVWDPDDGRLVTSRDEDGSRIRAIALSPSGSHVVFADETGNIRVQSTESGTSVTLVRETAVFSVTNPEMNNPRVRTLAMSKGGLVAATVDDGRVRLWNATTGEMIATLNDVSYGCAFSEDGSKLLTYDAPEPYAYAGNPNDLRRPGLYDAATGSPLEKFDRDVTASFDGRVFATYGPTVEVFALNTGEPVATILYAVDGPLLTIAPDGRVDGSLGAGGSGILIFWQVGNIQLPGFVGLQRERTPGLYAELIAELQ